MSTSVRDSSPAISSMQAHWQMIADLLGGTSTMRQAGEKHLPRWPNEEMTNYRQRLSVATLYPAFSRTVEVMAGKPFAKELQFSETTPPEIIEWCDDVDKQGRNLHAFAAELLRDCMSYGLAGVMVDFPKVANVRSQYEEKMIGARPYFVRYAPENILGFRVEKMNGADKLIQLRLLESVTENDGPFGEKVIEQVRVLEPGTWQTYRKTVTSHGETWALFEEGITTIQEIPFVFLYGLRKAFGIGVPPLLELAHSNIEHWQSYSDQQTITHVARVPILTIIGADDAAITVGASSAVKLPINASMSFVEHSGRAIEAGRQSLEDLEERMRQTGAELIVLQPGNVTATKTRSDNDANRSALQRIVEAFEDALDQALMLMAEWVGLPDGGEVELFKDFGAASLSDASAELLLKGNQAGKISDQTLTAEWKRRGILSPDLDWDDEQERIGEQGPAMGMMDEAMAVQTVSPDTGLQSMRAEFDLMKQEYESRNDGNESIHPNPSITINMPEYPSPVVNIAPAVVTVESPQVNISPPSITVESPIINMPDQSPVVIVESAKTPTKNKNVEIKRDDAGNIIGATMNNTEAKK